MVTNPRFAQWQHPSSSWGDVADTGMARSFGPVPGDPVRSAIGGAVAGVAGAWLGVAIAQGFDDPSKLGLSLQAAVGRGPLAGPSAGSVWLVIAIAAFLGMLPGAGLGWLMRRLHGLFPRLVFGAVLVPSVWIAVDAFGFLRFAPRLADHAFVPWLLGAVAYGACIACAGPVGLRKPRPWELGDGWPLAQRDQPIGAVGQLRGDRP